MISSWRRMAPDTMPALAKIGGQYVGSQLITMEAKENGFDEGIGLDVNGYVSEGAGENIFVVLDGTANTLTASLRGLTASSAHTTASPAAEPAPIPVLAGIIFSKTPRSLKNRVRTALNASYQSSRSLR